MPITRDDMPRIVELIDEAKQRVQEARTAPDDETRRERLREAEAIMRQLEELIAERGK